MSINFALQTNYSSKTTACLTNFSSLAFQDILSGHHIKCISLDLHLYSQRSSENNIVKNEEIRHILGTSYGKRKQMDLSGSRGCSFLWSSTFLWIYQSLFEFYQFIFVVSLLSLYPVSPSQMPPARSHYNWLQADTEPKSRWLICTNSQYPNSTH